MEVVCAVLRRDTELLLALRPEGKKLAGNWEFPGGKIEHGESSEEAVKRELVEELGCQVEVLRKGPVVLHTYPWCVVRMHSLECVLAPGSPEPHALEHDALAWVRPEELGSYALAPADVPLLPWVASLFDAE